MARTNATNFAGALQFPYATAGTDIFKKEDVQVLAQAVDQHDHTSGKGVAIPFGSIPSGTITSAMIADGTITSADIADGTIATVDLAAHAVSQVQLVAGTTLNPTSTSVSFVDLPDMLISMTTTGGDVLAFLVAQIANNTTTAAINIALNRDGTDGSGMTVAEPTANYSVCMMTMALYSALAAGAHTFKGRWSVSSGTATAISSQRYLCVLELKR